MRDIQEAVVQEIHGRPVITTQAFTHLNTSAHRPYLAKLGDGGEFVWQDRLYLGYGKHQITYYAIDQLVPGDYIQMAGGSTKNIYPFKAKVLAWNDDHIAVEPVTDQDWSNIVAARKKAHSTLA